MLQLPFHPSLMHIKLGQCRSGPGCSSHSGSEPQTLRWFDATDSRHIYTLSRRWIKQSINQSNRCVYFKNEPI